MKSLFLIVPAYNEEKRISTMLSQYSSFLESKRKDSNLKYKILIVLNGTTDNTLSIIKEFQKKNKFISVIKIKGKGKGLAILKGFNLALKENYDLIGFVDADLATPPQSYYSLVENINDSDGAIADRFLPESKIDYSGNNSRKISSLIFRSMVKILFNLPNKDTQCGAKVFKKHALKKLFPKITLSSWLLDLDLLYQSKRLGLKIKSIPTNWTDIPNSKLNLFSDSISMFTGLIKYRFATL